MRSGRRHGPQVVAPETERPQAALEFQADVGIVDGDDLPDPTLIAFVSDHDLCPAAQPQFGWIGLRLGFGARSGFWIVRSQCPSLCWRISGRYRLACWRVSIRNRLTVFGSRRRNPSPATARSSRTVEAYETKASAKNGIESVKKNAPDATVVDLSDSSS